MNWSAFNRQPIILASRSPRRKALLEQVGLSFAVHPSDEPESTIHETVKPPDAVVACAKQKALNVSRHYKAGTVIGADTIVTFGDNVFGKPKDEADAGRMLTLLSGQTHDVYTGLAVVQLPSKAVTAEYETTRVTFRTLTDKEIRYYIETGESMDKAGAYGIQGTGALLVAGIEGCYYNVVGLPLSRLYEMFLRITAGDR